MENPANNKKKNILKGVTVTAAGAVLLGGLATYAGWSDSSTFTPQTVTAGNLQVEALNNQTLITDLTTDTTIDLSSWTASPGDSVLIDMPMDIALQGDNLVASLDTSALEADLGPNAADYVTTDLQIVAENREALTPVDGEENTFLIRSDENDNADAADANSINAGIELDQDVDARAMLTVSFSADTPNTWLTTETLASLTEGTVDLAQQLEDSAGGEEVPEP